MTITSESNIAKLVAADPWMMQVLRAAETLNLPDWWIGAGFLRNKVWDAMEGNESRPTKDVDLVYFNVDDTSPEADWHYDEKMQREFPFAEWEVRNQARMHLKNDFPAYKSTAEGIANWVETATCVAVKLEGGELKFLFCHGTEDLLGLIARPTPAFRQPDRIKLFHDRIAEKRWRKKWPHLQVVPG